MRRGRKKEQEEEEEVEEEKNEEAREISSQLTMGIVVAHTLSIVMAISLCWWQMMAFQKPMTLSINSHGRLRRWLDAFAHSLFWL